MRPLLHPTLLNGRFGDPVLSLETLFEKQIMLYDLGADRALAVERAHLTTVAAGEIARAAKVRHVEPFHFSPRYAGQEQRMVAEVAEAFAGVGRPETAREGP